MRTPTTNPFDPGPDRVPQVWAGRTELLADFTDRVAARRLAGLGETGRVLLGEPGIGKSVLVRRLARTPGLRIWDTGQVRVPTGTDPLPLLARALLDLSEEQGLTSGAERIAGDLLDRVRSVSTLGVELDVEPVRRPAAHVVLRDALQELARLARGRDTLLLVHLDEVQNIDDEDRLSELLIALGDALAHDDQLPAPGGVPVTSALPLAVYLTGLPEFHDQASSLSGATFSRRFATTLLAPLADDDVAASLRRLVTTGVHVSGPDGEGTVTLAQDAADALVGLVHGDPYLFQLAGQHAWDAGSGPVVTVDEALAGWRLAAPTVRRHVERLIERLPELERRFVEAMASLPPGGRSLTSITGELDGYSRAPQLGPTAQRLDTVRGIISRHGNRRPYTFRARTVEALLCSGWPEEIDV